MALVTTTCCLASKWYYWQWLHLMELLDAEKNPDSMLALQLEPCLTRARLHGVPWLICSQQMMRPGELLPTLFFLQCQWLGRKEKEAKALLFWLKKKKRRKVIGAFMGQASQLLWLAGWLGMIIWPDLVSRKIIIMIYICTHRQTDRQGDKMKITGVFGVFTVLPYRYMCTIIRL